MAVGFCFSLLICFALVMECGARKRPSSTSLEELLERAGRFKCGSMEQCWGCEQCDDMCKFYNNSCCEKLGKTPNQNLQKWQYACVRTFPDMETLGLDCDDGQGVFMVTKCKERWTDSDQIHGCEVEEDSLLSRIPVYETNHTYITYKNVHCALCNDVNISSLSFWEFEVQCDFSENFDVVTHFDNEYCVTYLSLIAGNKFRVCDKYVIDTCSPYYSNFSLYDIRDRCEKGQDGPVYLDTSESIYSYPFYPAYKNRDCYTCNAVNLTEADVRDMLEMDLEFGMFVCDRPNPCHTPIPSYSLKQMVNLNIENTMERKYMLDKLNKGILQNKNSSCAMRNNNCSTAFNTCEFIEISESELVFKESTPYLKTPLVILTADNVRRNGTEFYVCLDEKQRKELSDSRRQEMIERIITFVGTLASITCLFVTFCLYVWLRNLRNYHGSIMMNLMIALFFAQLSFLVSFSVQNIKMACSIFGILTHYLFLVAFCAMNAVGFDTYKTFRCSLVKSSHKIRVLMSIIYSWALPLVIVALAIVFDYVQLNEATLPFRPGYGNGTCWINSANALLIFFMIPLAILKLIDIILFSATAVTIARKIKEGSRLNKNQNSCTFIINMKLALIMGLTWVFSFIANAFDNVYLWYMFILCNALQGFFIFLSLTCTRNVCGMIRKGKNKTTTTNGTDTTT